MEILDFFRLSSTATPSSTSRLERGSQSSGSSSPAIQLSGTASRTTRSTLCIIFYQGEYFQLIDANQNNYLGECLKIRNVLGEFEGYEMSTKSPYVHRGHKDFKKSPVAIVGAREYIFSENIGILGDLAAGKEQTFGTLVA